MLPELLEAAMLVAFGAAWPAALLKSWRSRTAKGKSLAFLLIISFGYLCGMSAKFAAGTVNYVVLFYAVNLTFILTDVVLYFRNQRLDRHADPS